MAEIKYLDLAGLKALYGVVDSKITEAITALDKADAIVDGEFVDSVSEADGIITVTRKAVAADKVTATAITGDDKVAVAEGTVASQIESLAKSLKTVEGNAAKYKVVQLTSTEIDGLAGVVAANVDRAYKVVSFVGTETETTQYTQVGEAIVIYKDQSLESVTTSGDENTIITFKYKLANGNLETVNVDLGKAIFESEMGNGMQVTGNKIAIKLADGNETFLTVGQDGLKLAGVQTAINNTFTTEIAKLDADVTSTGGAKVAVKVSEVDGKISAVNVTETDIASAAALTSEINRATQAEETNAAAIATMSVDTATQTVKIKDNSLKFTALTPSEILNAWKDKVLPSA